MKVDAILEDFFSFSKVRLSRLEGYESINYKVQSDTGTFVLKQHPNSVEIHALILAENQILNQLNDLEEYDFPVAIGSKTGLPLIEQENSIYRLLSFVEGDFLGDVQHSTTLLRSFGRFLAKMDNTIINSYNPTIAAKETQWDLKHFETNHRYLKYIPDAKNRSLVDYFFLQFCEHIYPVQYQLRKSIIHNDANDWNVLTKNGEVSGIIDFGDMCHSWLINELAVGLTYLMMDKENPLEIAMEVIQEYHKILPLEPLELDSLYYLVAARLCTSVCNSAYTKTLKPESDYITISEKSAWQLLRKWLRINPIKAKDAFRKAAGLSSGPKAVLKEQLKRRKSKLSNALSLSYDQPIQMYQSAFQYMYDAEGNAILDAYNNIMLAGHCHPTVVRAGQRCMAKLNTNTRYIYEELLSYSEKLLSKFPPELNKVFFVNSGSAASDLAMRLATTHTKKNKIMVLEHGYHGNTRSGIDISHYKYQKIGTTGKKDYIVETPMPKAFGSGFEDNGSAGSFFAKMALEDLDRHRGKIAAFIAEPIVGCGGQVPLAKGYLPKVYSEIRKQGGVCISDEVQVGFGRLGDYFWGFEMLGVIPDMVIIGKPMGNGHPIGAVITTDEIAKSFEKGPEFFSSFGGNPVSCAIGEAVLLVIEEEELQANAKLVGNHLKQLLRDLQQTYSEIADVRGNGLFLGVELQDKEGHPNTTLAAKIKNDLREKFILVSTDGPYDNVLKIKPPLSFTVDDAEKLVMEIRLILGDLIKV